MANSKALPTRLNEGFLKSILSQPSSPFREGHVINVVTHELDRNKVPYFIDPVGNIVVGVKSKAEYLKVIKEKSKEPLRVFIAHMDHPGFHGVKWKSPTQLEIKWHGGSPTQFLEGAAVWLADKKGWVCEGHMTQVQLIPSGKAIDRAIVEIPKDDHRPGLPKDGHALYGGLRFRAPFWQEGQLMYTKAADDLVGTFAVASLAIDLLGGGKKKKLPFIGLLTRAEEIGFIGCIGHFELGWLQQAKNRPLLCVSLETSRTLPGAEIGKGPVVRLGDRTTVFHANSLKVFLEVATKTLPDRHQKRVMDGGTCEATTAMAYGFPTVGISIPLGNYHNQSLEGGPDSAGPNGPAPEFVHMNDVSGQIELCRGLMTPKLNWANPWQAKIKEFKADYKGYKAHMQSGP